LWCCNACDIGGSVDSLVKKIKNNKDGQASEEQEKPQQERGPFPYNDDHVRAWQAALFANAAKLREFEDRRGLTSEVIHEFEIGWDSKNRAYTIPVRDSDGELNNVRWYQLDPADDRRKIWGVTGFNEPTLYPIDNLLEATEIIWCEGELDAILTVRLSPTDPV